MKFEGFEGIDRPAGFRVNLGLAISACSCRLGEPRSLQEIAYFCDCTREAIRIIEARALMKIRNKLQFGDVQLWNDLKEHLSAQRHPATRKTTH